MLTSRKTAVDVSEITAVMIRDLVACFAARNHYGGETRYTRRRATDWFSDRGSTPLRSISLS